jgi:hypothetical protein
MKMPKKEMGGMADNSEDARMMIRCLLPLSIRDFLTFMTRYG